MAAPGFVDLPSTQHFAFEYNNQLNATAAKALGKALADTAERDFAIMTGWFSPFSPERRIGTVTRVTATIAIANLPDAASHGGRQHLGSRIGAGEIGEFVFVECGELAVLGRVIETSLTADERLSVEPTLGASSLTCALMTTR